MPSRSSDVPDLVPARMINEVLYCERLMYLEWVQGEFADNAYTVEGRAAHRRVDRGGGRLPDPAPAADDDASDAGDTVSTATPAAPDRPVVARSVWLSDATLGITAKIDLVESTATTAVPIEYKRGAPPNLAEGAYLPERAQLGAHVLLLRAAGYECDRGILYFAGARRRVEIVVDAELESTVRRAVSRIREIAASGTIPPPLVGSPKCVGCSLSPLCLPDEVNLLAALDEEAGGRAAHLHPLPPVRVRRLQPARDDRVPLYVTEHRARIGLSGECLRVRCPDEPDHEVRIPNTSQVCVLGNAQITTQALRALMERGVPVTFFTTGGWFVGRATGAASNNIELRIAQHRAADDPRRSVSIARAVVNSKIRNCRTLLRRNASEPDPATLASLRHLARKALVADSVDELLGIEGAAARAYYAQLHTMFKQCPELGTHFDFAGRNRRPPKDPVNAMLSFLYALLVKDVSLAVIAAGLEPMRGFYHRPRFGRPSLALDLMEEFRPLIADSVVIGAINNGVVRTCDFIVTPVGTSLRAAARKRLILAYERRMDQLVTHPVFDYRISYRRVLEVQARLLARTILGEIPAYPTFQTR